MAEEEVRDDFDAAEDDFEDNNSEESEETGDEKPSEKKQGAKAPAVTRTPRVSPHAENFPEQEGRRNVHRAKQGNYLARLADGPEEVFYEGKKPAGFDKTYGKEIDPQGEDVDLLKVFYKYFNKKDGFLVYFNARQNYRFTICVPFKFSDLDQDTISMYRVDARSTLLKAGAEEDQVAKFCAKVAAHLKYDKNH